MASRVRLLCFAAAFTLAAVVASAQEAETQAFDPPKIQALPPSPQAKTFGEYLSAHFAASEHELADAGRYYRDALARDPEDGDILARAFLFTAASGDIDAASALAARVIKRTPDERTARLTLAVHAMAERDYAAARTQLAQSGRGPFSSLTLTLLDAWAAQGDGDTAQALKDLSQVTNQGGTEALARYHSALIYDLADKPADAEREYKAALFASGPSPREVEAYGRFLERQGRGADAKAYYNKFDGQPSLMPVIAQATARMAAGQTPERLIRTPQQGAAEALFGIAASLNDQSSADVAILFLRLGLYLSPDLDLAKIVLADRFEALEKYGDAVAVYDSVNASSPFKLAAAIQASVDKTRIGKTDEAITELTATASAHPDGVNAWTALGDAYRDTDKFAEAARAYDRAIKALKSVTEKDWPLFYARGVAEERTSNWSAAEADLKRALELSPEQAQVLNYLGYSWVDRGENLPKALQLLEKARALSPSDGFIVDSVGWAYYRLGRYKEATSALEQAVQLAPGDPTINGHLGDAYWRVGRRVEARFQWDHALFFGASDGDKAEIEKKLANGLPPESGKH